MQLGNFTLLKKIDSSLFDFAVSAENYAFSDRKSALVKLQFFTERVVEILCYQLCIAIEPNEDLLKQMRHPVFVNNVPIEIQQKLHLLLIKGDKTDHRNYLETNQSKLLDLIHEAYLLGKWLFLKENPQDFYPEYTQPVNDYTTVELNTYEEGNINSEQSRISSIKLQDCYNKYQLTSDQQYLVDELAKFLVDRTQNAFLLRGYAGTGKTFIIKGITDYLQLNHRNYMLAASTGKASRVLANKTGKNAGTIHSKIYNFNNLVEYKDENEPNTYKFYTNLKVNLDSSNTVYIIDEASMISDVYSDGEFIRFGSGRLLKDLINYINFDQNDHDKKVIFVGDNAQLPPIGMNFSPALDSQYLSKEYNLHTNEFELKSIVRQKSDSGIILNAQKIRNSLEKNEFNQLDFNLTATDIQAISEEDCIKYYLKTCNNQINGESIIVAYTNVDVHSYNKAVRQYFFPDEEFICKGDKIMCLRNTKLMYLHNNGQTEDLYIYNGDFGLVRQVAEQNEERVITLKRKLKSGEINKTPITLSFRDIEVGFRNENGHPVFIKTKIIENILYTNSSQLSSDEQKALYIDFCIRHPGLSYKKNRDEFKNILLNDPYFRALPIKFGYAITCHKAQGSEWNNVIVKCDAHKNKLSRDYFRWIYTAITRTSKSLYLINPPNKKLGSGIKIVGNEVSSLSLKQTAKKETVLQKPVIRQKQAQFDISKLTGISKLIANKIMQVLNNTNFVVKQIEKRQFHDIYTIGYDNQTEKFKVFYNAKNILTTIMPLSEVETSNLELTEILKKIINLPLVNFDEAEVDGSKNIIFSQDFLNEFHRLILEIIKNNDITILDASEQQWNIRYKFFKYDQIALIDIYFDAKHKFTKISPIITRSTSLDFINEIIAVLKEGLA